MASEGIVEVIVPVSTEAPNLDGTNTEIIFPAEFNVFAGDLKSAGTPQAGKNDELPVNEKPDGETTPLIGNTAFTDGDLTEVITDDGELTKIPEPSCGVEFIKIFGTFLETIPAGLLAGYLNTVVKNIAVDNRWLNFAARHMIPTYSAGAIFALLGTAFRYEVKYQAQRSDYPCKSRREYFSENMGEMMKFAVSLWAVGGTSFAIFTACPELAKGLGELPADIIAVSLGMITFAAGNLLPTLGLPWEKLADIAGVFGGFALGGFAVKKIGEAKDNVGIWLPAVVGAGGALVGNLGYKASSYLYDRFWVPEKKIMEISSEDVNHPINAADNEDDIESKTQSDTESSSSAYCCG